jgi:hypothetical protein
VCRLVNHLTLGFRSRFFLAPAAFALVSGGLVRQGGANKGSREFSR